MQRINRQRRDRGAVAVWVAIMLVPLLAIGALAIDVSSMHADRQRLQSGADAAALAIAQQCATGGACTPESATDLAQQLAGANSTLEGNANVLEVDLVIAERWVEVELTSHNTHVLAPVIGFESDDLTARGAASWAGGGMLPLAVPTCYIEEWNIVTSGDMNRQATFYNKFHNSNVPPEAADCLNVNGWSSAPGNFGWLSPEPACFAGIEFDANGAVVDTGNNETCALHLVRDSRVLIPVFSETNGASGSNVRLTITEYLEFTLTGARQSGSVWGDPGCSGSERCFTGTIHRSWPALDDGRPPQSALAQVVTARLELPRGY